MSEEEQEEVKVSRSARMLATVERVGNKLPDPAVLFVILLVAVWVLSWMLSYVTFNVVDPRTSEPLVINNLLSGRAITAFLSVGPKAAAFAFLLLMFLVPLAPVREQWLALIVGVAIATMTLGNLAAISQSNIKRLLGCSAISHA